MTISREKTNEIGGQWLRSKSYGITNGCVMSGSDSASNYDPWDAFRKNQGRYRSVDQPYLPLLELHRSLVTLEKDGITPSSVNERFNGPRNPADELLVEWCREHGLLGLVPGLSDAISCGRNNESFHRIGGLWQVATGANEEAGFSWNDTYFHRQYRRPLGDLHVFHAPTWRAQQNHVLEMKCPLSPGFWAEYCEPLFEIAYWSNVFARCVLSVSQWRSASSHDGLADVQMAYRTLIALAMPVSPAFEFNAKLNSLDEARRSPSLLCSYALMFLWDRVEGRRAIGCENCSSIFVSNEQRARYCSPACRNRANVRKHKERAANAQ